MDTLYWVVIGGVNTGGLNLVFNNLYTSDHRVVKRQSAAYNPILPNPFNLSTQFNNIN